MADLADGLTPSRRAVYAARIRNAPDIGALAALEREIAQAYPMDPATPRLLAELSLRWKRLEERN